MGFKLWYFMLKSIIVWDIRLVLSILFNFDFAWFFILILHKLYPFLQSLDEIFTFFLFFFFHILCSLELFLILFHKVLMQSFNHLLLLQKFLFLTIIAVNHILEILDFGIDFGCPLIRLIDLIKLKIRVWSTSFLVFSEASSGDSSFSTVYFFNFFSTLVKGY